MKLKSVFASCLLVLFCVGFAASQALPSGTFRAGAAKVETTPAPEQLPKGYLGVLDKVYARAVVIDNGQTSAALVSLDAGGVFETLWKDVSARAEKELGIPAGNILITATHSHSVPMGFPMPGATAGTDYEERVFQALKQARENLQPARISYGTGVSYINVQRDKIDPATHNWWEGANYAGNSDKTVAVIKIEAAGGEPIAFYYNYAVHAVITGTLDMVSGDIPGATSRYIENHYGNKVVALWSEGASGDQNPIYFQQTFDLRTIRIKDYAKRGIDISNAMPPGGQGMDRSNPDVARLMEEQKQMITSMGQMLGEEVLRVGREAKQPKSDGRLFGASTAITCPGRERVDEGRGGVTGSYKDGAPVSIKLGLMMIDDVAIGAVNGEVYSAIAQRFKAESPYAKTMMATLTNGFSTAGYIPDDASYGHATFEVLSTRLKPGCAESSIVNGLIDLLPRIAY